MAKRLTNVPKRSVRSLDVPPRPPRLSNVSDIGSPTLLHRSPGVRRKTVIRIGFTLIIAGLFLGVVGYQKHQSNVKTEKAYKADKARFAQVEADMDKAYAAIVGAVGEPVEDRKERSCSYVSLKFAKGQLSCGIGYVFINEITDRNTLIETFLLMKDQIKNTGEFTGIKSSTDELLQDKNSALYHDMSTLRAEFRRADGVDCELGAEQSSRAVYKDAKSDLVMRNIFSCYQDMQRPIYTLAE